MLNAMKCFSSLGAIIMLLVGLAISAVTVLAFIYQDVFFSEENLKHTALNSLLVVCFCILVVGVLGIIGIVRKNCCLIAIYQLFVFIFLGLFLSIGIATEILPDKVFDGNCTISKNPLIESAYKAYNKSDTVFCTNECPCALLSSSMNKWSPTDQLILKDKTKFVINQTNGALSTQKCPKYTNESDSDIAIVMTKLQEILECSNWCDNSQEYNLIYRFSDINNGKPHAYCYPRVKEEFNHYATMVAIPCFIVAAIFFLVCVCNICLCCHPDRKKLEFRDRFIYVGERQDRRQRGGYQRF